MPSAISSLIVAHATGLDLRLTAAAVAWSTALVVAAALVVATLRGRYCSAWRVQR